MRDNQKCDDCQELTARVSAIEEAFPLNDLKKPDYHLHRKSHLADMKADEKMEELKFDATRQIAMWVLGIALTLIGLYFGVKP